MGYAHLLQMENRTESRADTYRSPCYSCWSTTPWLRHAFQLPTMRSNTLDRGCLPDVGELLRDPILALLLSGEAGEWPWSWI
jgi:hypothetical protein